MARLTTRAWSISAGQKQISLMLVGLRLLLLSTYFTVLEAPLGIRPVRRIQTIAPVSITQSPSGQTVVDFGQNLVGRLVIKGARPCLYDHTTPRRSARNGAAWHAPAALCQGD